MAADASIAPSSLASPGTLGLVELWLSLGVAGAALMVARGHALWAPYFRLACPLFDLTGVPCLACGGTRAMAAVAAGHWFEALGWNPLVAAGGVGLVAWVPACLLMIGGVAPRPVVPTVLGSRVRWALALLLAANWVYLVLWFRG